MSKKILAILMAVAMAFSLLPVTAVAVDAAEETIKNPKPVTSSDGYVTLEKTAAKAGEGDNTFDITLKVTIADGKEEGEKTSTDAVLVIDRSRSMKGDRLTSAQEAAKQFAEVVLGTGDNSQNKIAVVSYAKTASTNTGLTSDLNAVKNAIAFTADGGTNIQAGIKAARDILAGSNADNRVILVLSDGAPTYSFKTIGTASQTGCKIKRNTHKSGSITQNSVEITGFSYGENNDDVVGTGGKYELENGTTLSVTCEHGTYQEKYTYYKNNGQPTIQEATYAKDAGCEIYSIYLGSSSDSDAISTMKGIATDDNHYKLAKDAADLGGLFKGIAEDITVPVTPGTVTDPMGDHMNLVAASLENNDAVSIGENQFTWDLTKVTPEMNQNGSRTYELTYQITFDTDFTGFDANKFYPTNKTTTLGYTVKGTQETANFQIPEVKGKAVTYRLTYDANGGIETTVPTDDAAYPVNADATLNDTVKPTHENAEGKTIIFIGWSATKDTKIYDKGDANPSLIRSVKMDADKTVYAVWGYDTIGENNRPDDVPDVFNAVVTYNIVNGTWDGTNASATEVIKVKTFDTATKEWTDTNAKLSHIPDTTKVTPAENYTSSGTWGDSAPSMDTIVKTDTTYTYTLEAEQPAPTGTLTVTKQVKNLALNELSDTFRIKVTNAENSTRELSPADSSVTKDETNGTLTWTISNLPVGTYTVSEENADVNGYTCTATYNATSGASATANSATTDQPATDAQTVTVTTDGTSTMTVTNKYTKREVEPIPDTSKPVVNKTATDLVNDKTDVTLSIGGKSAKENVAVMFLLDKSTSQGIRDEAAKMIDELATKTNTNILYDVVIFSGTARSSGWQNIQDTTTLDRIKSNFVNGSGTSGTNMSAGILKAKTDIATLKKEHTEYTETYLITLSDGITYVWSEEDQEPVYCVPVKNIGNNSEEGSIQTGPDVWNMMYDYGDSLQKIYGSVSQFLSAMPSKIEATKTDNHVKIYDNSENPIETYIYDDSKTKETTDKYACGPEAAMYYSITGYAELAKEFTKTFAYAVPELDKSGQDNVKNWTDFPWGREAMEYCKSISFNKEWDGNVSNTNPGKIFSGIKDVIYYEIQSGSITDVIGADFSLTDQTLTQNTFTLTVNGKVVTANVPTGNVITFGEKDESTGKYPYVLTYYKGTATKNADNTYTITSGEKTCKYTPCDTTGEVNGPVSDEFFVLEMNVPVVSLELKYNLSLTSKRTAAGTYEVPTNESATLEYTPANGVPGSTDFNEPTVSYTIKGGNNGGHGGNSKPSLNTKDHYGYIIGYPVDYYSGQPTTDQTKKPVRPEGKITRAEVATIYFRMLTDESRAKFWSQSNAYSDVKAGDWFNNAVSTLSNAGIIAGYEDGSFRPNGYITRAEFATIAARFFDAAYDGKDLFPDISGHWAKDYINQAANKGFVNGYEDGSFRPDRNITRAEAVTLVNRTLERHPDKSHFTKDMLTWPDNMDTTKWYYADMQEATNSHTYESKENSDKTKYENWTKTLSIRNWEALEKEWSNANSSQGTGNVV